MAALQALPGFARSSSGAGLESAEKGPSPSRLITQPQGLACGFPDLQAARLAKIDPPRRSLPDAASRHDRRAARSESHHARA